MLNINAKLGFSGRFKIEARQPDGSIKELCPWFDNLITDAGLDRLAIATANILPYCRIGTGTATPTVSDTTLQTHYASTSSRTGPSITAQPSAPYFITHTFTYTFAQGAVVGNMSEIGVGWTATGSGLWSRARIKDGGGSDTTISVVALDQLIITYAAKVSMVTTDVVTTPTINGISTTVTIRPNAVTSTDWAKTYYNGFDIFYAGINYQSLVSFTTGGLAAITSGRVVAGGSWFSGDVFGMGSGTYTNGTFNLNVSGTAGIGSSNQVNTMLNTYATFGSWQVHFNPGITKINTQTLAITLNVAWARV